jgi:hypothetical protein
LPTERGKSADVSQAACYGAADLGENLHFL